MLHMTVLAFLIAIAHVLQDILSNLFFLSLFSIFFFVHLYLVHFFCPEKFLTFFVSIKSRIPFLFSFYPLSEMSMTPFRIMLHSSLFLKLLQLIQSSLLSLLHPSRSTLSFIQFLGKFQRDLISTRYSDYYFIYNIFLSFVYVWSIQFFDFKIRTDNVFLRVINIFIGCCSCPILFILRSRTMQQSTLVFSERL